VLAKYSEHAKVRVTLPAAAGSVAAVYGRWLQWAEAEVKAGRLARRTLDDYESHWKKLEPAFGAGPMNGLGQPVLLQYFDRRSSKDRAKREVNFVGLLCAWARPRGVMQALNPVECGMRLRMKVQRKLNPPVPADVYRVVWTCGEQLVRDTLDLSYMLATRPAEALRVPMPDLGRPSWRSIAKDEQARSGSSEDSDHARASGVHRSPARPEPEEPLLAIRRRRPPVAALGHGADQAVRGDQPANKICEKLEIKWIPLTRQQLRPTGITQVDKVQGREGARKLAGHTTEKQTADYIRHEAEEAVAAKLPPFDPELVRQVEALTGK